MTRGNKARALNGLSFELAPVPEEIYAEVPSARPYRYFMWNNRVVLVEPGSRRVIEIID